MYRNLLTSLFIVFCAFIIAAPVHAAAPDGGGPWADSVVGFSQGPTKSAGAVPATRSDPASALGVAENDTVEPHFVSLGFGGSLTLGFDNTFNSAVIVVEATNPGYPTESANIEVSANGSTWVSAGSITQDGQINVPTSLGCAKYVRITDTSNAADFAEATADAFDVDGVRVTGEACTTPTPTPPCHPTPGCPCGSTNAVISGNGAGSTNTIIAGRSNTNTVRQTNRSATTTVVAAKSNTGKNKTANNTGGSSTTSTGNASTGVAVSTSGGTNSSH